MRIMHAHCDGLNLAFRRVVASDLSFADPSIWRRRFRNDTTSSEVAPAR